MSDRLPKPLGCDEAAAHVPAAQVLLDQLVEAVARRAAELVLEQLSSTNGAGYEPEHVTVARAAELYGCKRQRIYELRSARRLTPYKEGGRAMVKRSELEALIRNPDAGELR